MGLCGAAGFGKVKLFGVVLAGSWAGGCDIEGGFRDTSDALFPQDTTYLDVPGVRLSAGSYRSINLARGTEPLVLARGGDPDDGSLHVIRYGRSESCAIPDVGSYRFWDAGRLSYMEGDTLRFADERCRVRPLAIPDGRHPVTNLTNAAVVRAGRVLLRVDFANDATEELATDVSALHSVPAGHVVVTGEGLLGFTRDWQASTSIDLSASRIVAEDKFLLIENDEGIHQLTLNSRGDGVEFDLDTVDADGCSVTPSLGRLYYYSPCAAGTVVAWERFDAAPLELGTGIDPRYVRVQSVAIPPDEHRWTAYLRDIDEGDGVGTLVARSPEGVDYEVGERAVLSWFTMRTGSDGRVRGRTLVDVRGDVGRLISWEQDGAVEELAGDVLRNSALNLLVNFDGSVGDYAVLQGNEIQVLAHGVPPDGFSYSGEEEGLISMFFDYDGASGTLALGRGAGLSLRASPRVVAHGVVPSYYEFLDLTAGLPGIVYLADFDVGAGAGRLAYHNFELDFTAPIRGGVSDFISGFGGVFYLVEDGPEAGIWWTRAK
ncbi:MAG TPA: hypothetical protein VF989_15785 [Polyangiaceae bacterium]|jgi:hypothetical protein